MIKLSRILTVSQGDFFNERKSLRILIIRPGETFYDMQRYIQGNLDLHLTEKGKQEAARLAQELEEENLEQIYTSPNTSAVETADLIASSLNVPTKILKGLKNQHQGLWEGRRVDEIQRFHPRMYRCFANFPSLIEPPKGESIVKVMKRLRAIIQWILKHHKNGTIGLVVCEPIASIMRCCLKSEEARNLWDYIGRHGLWEPVEISKFQIT